MEITKQGVKPHSRWLIFLNFYGLKFMKTMSEFAWYLWGLMTTINYHKRIPLTL